MAYIPFEDGIFFDMLPVTGPPYIVDYDCIDRELTESLEFGDYKEKREIHSLDNLISVVKKIIATTINSIIKIKEQDKTKTTVNSFNYRDFEIDDDIIYQIVFDILYQKYLEESPKITLMKYCKDYIHYECEINDSKDVDKSDYVNSTYKWMKSTTNRMVDVFDDPALRGEITALGVDYNVFFEYIKRRNEPGKNDVKFPKHFLDHVYYNGNSCLITSKQFNRSFNNNNYSYDDLNKYLGDYDNFIKVAFNPEDGNEKDYFIKSMDYYHLESYKRIDYIYKITIKIKNTQLSLIDKNHFPIRRYTPLIIKVVEDRNKAPLRVIYKNYKPLIFIDEKIWEKIVAVSLNEKEINDIDLFCEHYYFIRAKVYELFRYHYKLVSDDYNDMAKFLKEHYNVLDYRVLNKTWIQKDKVKKKDKNALLKTFIAVNDELFSRRTSKDAPDVNETNNT